MAEEQRPAEAGSDYSIYLRAYIRALVDQTVRARALPRRERTLWLAARAAWDARQENAPLSRSKLQSYLGKAGFEV